jgi:hypothetical protein
MFSLLFSVSLVKADAAQTGNCLTQRIDFKDALRIFNMQGIPPTSIDFMSDLSSKIDPSRYDITIDYGNKDSIKGGANGGISLNLQKDPAGGESIGTRISTTRFLKYGKITASFKAATLPGIVNTMITAGPHLPDPLLATVPPANIAKAMGDEIDLELLGKV